MPLTEVGARLTVKGQPKYTRDMRKMAGDGKQVEQSLDRAGRAGSRFGTAIGKGTATAISGMRRAGSAASRLGGAMKTGLLGGVAAVGLAVPLLGKSVLDTATRLEGMAQKARVVYGEALPQVTKWAEKSAEKMGLTRNEATGLAAGIADLLVPIGFTRTASADLSTSLVGLSGALAQWSGGQYQASDVAGILQGAILGETDALQALGIAISAADVEARLASQGMQALTGDARKQAEAQAITALIFEKSTDAQKAFADGGLRLASVQARLSAKVKTLRENLAQRAAPYLLRGLETFERRLPQITTALGDFTRGALGPIREGLRSFGESLGRIQERFSGLGNLEGKASAAGEGIGSLVGGLITFAGKAAEVWAAVQSGLYRFMRSSLTYVGTVAGDLAELFAALSKASPIYRDQLAEGAVGLANLAAGISKTSMALDDLTKPRDIRIRTVVGADDSGRAAEAAARARGTTTYSTGGRRRHGGPVRRRHAYTVGEAGRETVVPREDGFVVTQQQAARAAAAAPPAPPAPERGGVDTIVVPVILDGRQITEVVVTDVRRRRL